MKLDGLVIFAREKGDTPEAFYVTHGPKSVTVVARRHASLVDLKFTFEGYECRQENRTAAGVIHAPYLRQILGYGGPFSLVVEFPPQHVAEEVFPKEEADLPANTRTRLSGPSRLAFAIPRNSDKIDLTLAELTDWSGFQSLVQKRADASIGSDYRSQLNAVLGSGEDYAAISRDNLNQRVRDSLVPPSDQQTALELAGRLLFSPNQNATWVNFEKAPPKWSDVGGVRTLAVPLWSLRLAQSGRGSVRAVWSKRFEPKRFPHELAIFDQSGVEIGPDKKRRSMLSLSPLDHWEIVGQTSVYGLTALRRLHEPQAGQVEPPSGGVVRPVEKVVFLEELDHKLGYTNKDSGIATASPFRDADIIMTSLGASFAAEWKGEPAALLPKPPLPTEASGFELERLAYRSWLGRDSHVVAVYKGFLYPLGVRASYVIVHERQIREAPGNEPISYLVRRSFIVAPATPRPFPGPYHPHDARDFPASTIRMKTLVTPTLELDHIFEEDDLVFWPMVRSTALIGIDFQFEWTSDDNVTARSPLVFVGNNAAHDPALMRKLNAIYQQAPVPRRTAVLGGARKRYAPEKKPEELGHSLSKPDDPAKPGETSFDTDLWVMGARGRVGPDSSAFDMDGRMEGADQPPFYPFVENAIIGIQAVDRLLGVANGRYDVSFHDDYREKGWVKDAEIYLRLREAGASINSTMQPGSTGGVASQDVNIGGISRLIGPVGGEKPKRLADGIEIDISKAESGGFDPKQFFGDVKLLGLLELKDLIKIGKLADAPKLLEQVEFGAQNEGLELIRAAAKAAYKVLYGSNRPIDTIKQWLIGSAAGIAIKDLYGELHRVLSRVVYDLRDPLRDLGTVSTTIAAAELARTILAIVNPAIGEIERLLGDPIPQNLRVTLETLRAVLGTIADQPRTVFKELVDALADEARAWLMKAFCEALTAQQLGPVLFGKPQLTCDDLTNPIAAFDQAARSLFDLKFAQPVATALAKILRWTDHVALATGLVGEEVKTIVCSRLDDAVATIETRLEPLVGKPPFDDIRASELQRAFATEVWSELTNLVKPPAGAESEKVIELLGTIDDALSAWKTGPLKARIDELRANIKAAAGEDVDAILADIRSGLEAAIEREIVGPLKDKARKLKADLVDAVAELGNAAFAQLMQVITATLEALMASVDVAEIVKAGQGWCDDLNAAATAFSYELTGPIADARWNLLKPLIVKAQKLVPAASTDPNISRVLGALIAEARRLDKLLENAGQPQQFDLCGYPGEGLGRVTAAVNLRRDVAAALNRIAAMTAQLANSLPDAAEQLIISEIVALCAKLYLDQAALRDGVDAAWNTIKATVTKVADGMAAKTEPYAKAYADELRHALVEVDPKSLRGILSDHALTAAILADTASGIDEFLAALDRELVGRLFEIVALGAGLSDAVIEQTASAIRDIAKALKTIVIPLYSAVEIAIGKLLSLTADPGVTGALLRYALQSQLGDPLAALTRARELARNEREAFEKLASEQPASDTVTQARLLWTQFSGGNSALKAVQTIVETLQMANFGQVFIATIRDDLEQVLDEARQIVRQFVPTKVVTVYDWGTNIKQLDVGGDWLVKFPSAAAPQDLVLKSTFTFDFATKKATSEIKGTLQPFQLKIATPAMLMATITFAETTFVSINGGSPEFDMKVQNVVIGPFLSYIQKLQEWLAPAGSGFYLVPAMIIDKKTGKSFPGIEAGYVYDAGIIQLGSLQFLNVAFTVSAGLPFNGGEAVFTFKLASEERPFLIANPPYGGGGYLALTCDLDGVRDIAMSFVFGGVAGLQFGPLRAQARVCAGVGLRLKTIADDNGKARKTSVVIAIFEAVGEGSIACFSIAVSLRVTLTQYDGGVLFGQTTYQFSFKVGWFKIKYQVTANYRLAGNGKKPPDNLRLLSTYDTIYCSDVEPKATQWVDYNKHLALDLL